MTARGLQEAFTSVRRASERLAEPLSDEDCQLQSMPDASPVKWHLAHTTWFFEAVVLASHAPKFKPYDARWAYLFNSYYEALGPRHPRALRGVLSRPTRSEIGHYRRVVDEQILALLDDPSEAVRSLVTLGLHHEQQHQELLLTDIQHAFSLNVLGPKYQERPLTPQPSRKPLRWLAHDGGLCRIGHRGSDFSFDNETPEHSVHLVPFALSSHLVTSAEYQAFIADRGYDRPELWLADGWATARREQWRAPLYWTQQNGSWQRYSLHGIIEVDAQAPVCHVSYYEADAYARWAGARLPTEAEWETAVRASSDAGQLADSASLVPVATDSLMGSAWVWTQSPYSAYPGFRPLTGAVAEYNGKFMCNQLVLRGGSCFTPPNHVRSTYRNFFYPDARWQVSGIRLARDLGDTK